ncbi:Niban-like protein 1 [Bagarius yarrelli]|uniref:Niban-like protein 1 n=1 Tax=Bagarius yarrelli TaxID=175774 RepID=A0A556TUB5_BAGYA|nr:Niban-like protein 1 [Bagarius yarrelli]
MTGQGRTGRKGQDRTGQDRTGQERKGKERKGKERKGKEIKKGTGQKMLEKDKTEMRRTQHKRKLQSRAEKTGKVMKGRETTVQDRAGHGRKKEKKKQDKTAGQDRAEKKRTGQGRTRKYRTGKENGIKNNWNKSHHYPASVEEDTKMRMNDRKESAPHTRKVMTDFRKIYEQQYAVALFNSVRFEIEGGGNMQTQLLHRKDPLQDKAIFSGDLFQYLDENKKWRNRFIYVANSYNISFYDSRLACERGLQPRGHINCAGYKALTSMDEYLDLLNSSLPDSKGKQESSPFLKSASSFLLILWHPYARHHYFMVRTEKEQTKWLAVLQDCIRHANNGLSEENKVLTPAFTDSLRLYRQAKGHYGTWDMMCGDPAQILANLVMETLYPELRAQIGPRLKGKLQQRQRNWMLISDAVYRQVLTQTRTQHEAMVQASLVLTRADQVLKTNVQPYITSILEALMEPVGQGFAEVRDVLFREMVEISKNAVNDGGNVSLGKHMEKMSMLAFHPVKMQSCYEKMEQLRLEGLQQRFDVSSPSVFVHRGQILMREQMDNAVYTFEQLLHQNMEDQSGEDFLKNIQRCQDRVLKKFDYDSSTVRKKFFREALLQIIIPYMLKQLHPVYASELPKFEELIFEDFSRFILVENTFEEVVLQSVTKDIMMAVKDAANQRRHNLYRDSMVLANSDPNLHLLEGNSVDWASHYGGGGGGGGGGGEDRSRRRRQVVSMIVPEGMAPMPYGSCLEVPGVEEIPEENEMQSAEDLQEDAIVNNDLQTQPIITVVSKSFNDPGSPDSVHEIQQLIRPVIEVVLPTSGDIQPVLNNGMLPLEEGLEIEAITTEEDMMSKDSAIASAIQELENAVQDEDCNIDSDAELTQASVGSSPRHHDDSGFQSPTNENAEEEESRPIGADLKREVEPVGPELVMVMLKEEGKEVSRDDPAKSEGK